MGTFQRLFSAVSAQKRRRLIVALGAAGLALIFVSSVLPEKPEPAAETASAVSEPAEDDCAALERELEEMLSHIDGAGEVRVMITMDSTTEDVYAVDKSESESRSLRDGTSQPDTQRSEQNEYVIVKGRDGGEQALLRKQRMPEVRGVLVVCSGAGSAVTREKVTLAVSGALGVERSKVVVVE